MIINFTIELLFLSYWILKQFYLLESGSFQVSDSIAMLCFLLIILQNGLKSLFRKEDIILLLFFIFVTIINLIYYLLYREISFILSTLYYYFNYIIIIEFRYLAKTKRFIEHFSISLLIGILLQLFLMLMNIGLYEEGRYIGTFNDPNQCAYYIISSFFLFCFASSQSNRIKNTIYFLLINAVVIYIIIETASTGVILSLVVFYVLQPLNAFRKKNHMPIPGYLFLLFLFSPLIILLFQIDFSRIGPFLGSLFEDSSINIVRRIGQKISIISGEGHTNHANINEDRNWILLYYYPKYLIFGAGQGFYQRFLKTTLVHEVHSTWLGLLFSYGIIPFSIFIMWVYKNINKLFWDYYPIYISFAVEALFLVNQRQPSFWVLIVIGNVLLSINMEHKGDFLQED